MEETLPRQTVLLVVVNELGRVNERDGKGVQI